MFISPHVTCSGPAGLTTAILTIVSKNTFPHPQDPDQPPVYMYAPGTVMGAPESRFQAPKMSTTKTRTDRRSRLSPDEARRKITRSTCDLYGVSTSRLPMYLCETTNLGVLRFLTGVYLRKLQPPLTVLRKKSMSSRKSQKTYVFFTSFAI